MLNMNAGNILLLTSKKLVTFSGVGRKEERRGVGGGGANFAKAGGGEGESGEEPQTQNAVL